MPDSLRSTRWYYVFTSQTVTFCKVSFTLVKQVGVHLISHLLLYINNQTEKDQQCLTIKLMFVT